MNATTASLGDEALMRDADTSGAEAARAHVNVELELEKIDVSPYQPRLRNIERKDVDELMRSLSATGQVTPVVVTPAAGGRYVLIAGHRRCAALKFLGATTVLAVVRTDLDERAARKLVLADNLAREDLSAYEQALALQAYCECHGVAVEDAATEIGISRRTAFRLKQLLGVSEDLRVAFRELHLSARAAEILAKLDTKNPKRAVKLASKFANGEVSLTDLEDEVRKATSSQPKHVVAKKDVAFSINAKGIDLRVCLQRGTPSDEQKERVLEAIAQLLAHLGVPQINAAASAEAA